MLSPKLARIIIIRYPLTDPVVLSRTGEFGATDGGVEAMKSFLLPLLP